MPASVAARIPSILLLVAGSGRKRCYVWLFLFAAAGLFEAVLWSRSMLHDFMEGEESGLGSRRTVGELVNGMGGTRRHDLALRSCVIVYVYIIVRCSSIFDLPVSHVEWAF